MNTYYVPDPVLGTEEIAVYIGKSVSSQPPHLTGGPHILECLGQSWVKPVVQGIIISDSFHLKMIPFGW